MLTDERREELRHCMDCQLPYSSPKWLEAIVMDEAWATISGRSDGSGLLCGFCMDVRAKAFGIAARASLYWVGVALTGTSQSDAHEQHVARLCAKLERQEELLQLADWLLGYVEHAAGCSENPTTKRCCDCGATTAVAAWLAARRAEGEKA